MELARNIWDGYLQFGATSTTRQFLLLVDIIAVSVLAYFFLRTFNTRRGFSYLGLLLLSVALLATGSNFNLGGLHLAAQVMLVLLVVGLPIFFEEKWLSLFNKDATVNAPLPPRFLGAIPIALISLVLALLLVGVNNGPAIRTAELPQGVAVSAANVKEGISANFGSQKRIGIIVRAPRSVWSSLGEEDFSAVVDARSLDEGTHEVPVTVSSKNTEVEIVRTEPTRITVTLEPVIRKTVVVVTRFSGKASDDLVPDEPALNPDKVEVTGPKSLVEDITQGTIQVKLDDQIKTIEQKFALVALDSSGSVIEDVSFEPAEVEARIPLVKAGKLKNVGVIVRTTGQPATGFWVKNFTVTPATVAVTGNVDTLDKLSSIETDAISVSGLSSDTELTATLSFPTGIVAAEGTQKVSVKVEVGQTSTTKQIVPTIQYDGVDASLKVTSITPTSINAVVGGTSATLAGVSGGDVTLKLNLSPYKSAGTYAVTVKNEFFVLTDGVNLVSFLPSVISVTLEIK